MSFDHVFKRLRQKGKDKRKRKNTVFRPIWWLINWIWEPWRHFIPCSHEELPMATAQKEVWKHQSPSCLSCAQPEGIWSHRALPPLSWNSSLCNHSETSPTFKSRIEKGQMSSYLCPETWLYSSLLATDTVGFLCSILQEGLSAAHRWQPWHFFSTVSARPKWISKEVLKRHCEICGFEPLPRSMRPQQSQGQFSSRGT